MTPRTKIAALVVVAAAASGAALAKPPLAMPKGLPAYGPDKPLPSPTIVTETLANGVTVWIIPRPGFPKVEAAVVVRGGNAADPADLPGVSDVLASALKEGTAKRTSRQIAEQMQAIGGSLDASNTADATFVEADALASGAPALVEIAADVALNPSFPKDEVELVKANALEDLKERASRPEFAVEKAYRNAVYGEHPYHVIAPTQDTVAKVTPELLRAEHARRFRPERALVVIAGAIDPEAIKPVVRKAFGAWAAAGPAPAPLPPVPAAHAARTIVVVDRPGSVQAEIRVGRPTMKASDPDYHAMVVANTIFGGAFSSRLNDNIREDKGYTYSPGSGNQAAALGGLLTVRAAVRTDVTAATLLEVFYELDRMGATLPSDEEMARAKRYQTGLYLLRNSLNGAIVGTLATSWVNGLPPTSLAEFVPKVNAVTAAEVEAVGRKYMPSLTQTVAIGGDAATIVPAIAEFGAAKVVQP